jgi:hypothetical protein
MIVIRETAVWIRYNSIGRIALRRETHRTPTFKRCEVHSLQIWNFQRSIFCYFFKINTSSNEKLCFVGEGKSEKCVPELILATFHLWKKHMCWTPTAERRLARICCKITCVARVLRRYSHSDIYFSYEYSWVDSITTTVKYLNRARKNFQSHCAYAEVAQSLRAR